MLPARCSRCATPASVSAARRQRAELCGGRVDVRVDVVVAWPQRREAGRGRDRVPGQRARLVDRADGRELGHDVGAAAERRGREAAADDLAERHQVGAHAVEAEPAGAADAEAGHHLVADEQRAVVAAQLGQTRR